MTAKCYQLHVFVWFVTMTHLVLQHLFKLATRCSYVCYCMNHYFVLLLTYTVSFSKYLLSFQPIFFL